MQDVEPAIPVVQLLSVVYHRHSKSEEESAGELGRGRKGRWGRGEVGRCGGVEAGRCGGEGRERWRREKIRQRGRTLSGGL